MILEEKRKLKEANPWPILSGYASMITSLEGYKNKGKPLLTAHGLFMQFYELLSFKRRRFYELYMNVSIIDIQQKKKKILVCLYSLLDSVRPYPSYLSF